MQVLKYDDGLRAAVLKDEGPAVALLMGWNAIGPVVVSKKFWMLY